jgi:hypothetical protein
MHAAQEEISVELIAYEGETNPFWMHNRNGAFAWMRDLLQGDAVAKAEQESAQDINFIVS